jgi:hypothetical protein
MARRHRWLFAAPFVLAAATAHAQGANDHDKAVALFDEAVKLIDANDCDTAQLKLDQSLRYEQSVGAHLSMANCIESHNPLEAWKHLREAQRLAYLKHDERSKIAADRATALEARLPVVHVVIPALMLQEPGLEVRVDGVIVDRFFYESGMIAMPAGAHAIEASTPTRRWSHDVVAQAGATTNVTVNLQPIPTAPAAQVVEGHERGGGQRAAGLVIGGLGLGVLAAGGILGAAALVKKSDITTACGGNAHSCTAPVGSLDTVLADHQTFAHLATVSFVVGGAAFLAGTLLFLTAPHSRSVAVTGAFDGRSGGVQLLGRF